MNRRFSSPQRMAGLSLVEMMIALVIGLILTLGVIQVFSASQAASRLSEGVSRVQENARFALDFLERDIRMAGHMGCINDQAHVVKGMGDPLVHLGAGVGSGSPLDFGVAIQGYEAPGTSPGDSLTLGEDWSAPESLPAAISDLLPAPAGGSDILVLRFLAPEGVPVDLISVDGSDSELTLNADHVGRVSAGGVGTPTLFGVADCGHADVFTGTLADNILTVPGVDLSRYTAQPTGQTMVYRAESLVYYVAANADTGVLGLRRARADDSGEYVANEEVVEGIESLQLMFGLDTTADIGRATPPAGNITSLEVASDVSTATDATATAEWLRVGQVRLGLMASSPQRASSATPVNPPAVLGVSVANGATSDGRFRAAYEVTVALRNRLFGN